MGVPRNGCGVTLSHGVGVTARRTFRGTRLGVSQSNLIGPDSEQWLRVRAPKARGLVLEFRRHADPSVGFFGNHSKRNRRIALVDLKFDAFALLHNISVAKA